jgi:release factor glutamine methyltransferase
VTIAEALRDAERHLAERGVESPRADAELLVGKALGLSRVQLYVDLARPLSPEEFAACRELIERRGRREPLAYVLGEWGFRRLTLRVDPRALVPRPETEVVVERCLALLADAREPRVLDLGTGTGAIALALADEHPGARVVALDSSPDALALARENADRLGLGDRVRLVEGDLGSPPGSAYDLVVSNPPYVGAGELAELAPEVRDWEPRGAILDAGQTETVTRVAVDLLRPGGSLVLEVAWRDGEAGHVAGRLMTLGFEGIRITRDLAGRERVVEGRRP